MKRGNYSCNLSGKGYFSTLDSGLRDETVAVNDVYALTSLHFSTLDSGLRDETVAGFAESKSEA